MEASSHGLDQRRLDGVRLAAGAFTNLGRDHMDYHPTVEDYHQRQDAAVRHAAAEGRAGRHLRRRSVVASRRSRPPRRAGLDVLTVGRQGDFLALKRVEHERHRQRAEVEADGVLHEIDLPLAGDFQICNALVAAGLAIATGTPAAKALDGAREIEGRARPARTGRHHRATARRSMSTMRTSRTRWKTCWPRCGRSPPAASSSCSAAAATATGASGRSWARSRRGWPTSSIVTDDNPRSEVPETIRAAILAAAPGAIEIGDRRKAIHEAVAMLNAGDTLIVAGKGHEEGQTIGAETLPFLRP